MLCAYYIGANYLHVVIIGKVKKPIFRTSSYQWPTVIGTVEDNEYKTSLIKVIEKPTHKFSNSNFFRWRVLTSFEFL